MYGRQRRSTLSLLRVTRTGTGCVHLVLARIVAHVQWAKHIVDADVLDIENVTEALRTGPYGRCVYHAGNDVVDHQVVNIEYEGGVTASMTMSACECCLVHVVSGDIPNHQSPSPSVTEAQ